VRWNWIIILSARDVVLTKKVCERTQKIAILKQLQTHFKAKREKDVGSPFPRVPALLHPCCQQIVKILTALRFGVS